MKIRRVMPLVIVCLLAPLWVPVTLVSIPVKLGWLMAEEIINYDWS